MVIVRLHNLSARAPSYCDAAAVASLLDACDEADSHSARDVLDEWNTIGFHLKTDAWVITSRHGQVVSYAALRSRSGDEDPDVVLDFTLLVHPDYQERGVETLLLWLIEARAHEMVAVNTQGARMVLRIRTCSSAQRLASLLLLEGYVLTHHSWRLRIAVDQVAACSSALSSQERQFVLDVALHMNCAEVEVPYMHAEQRGQADDGDMYKICQYDVYEKVLRDRCCHVVDQALTPMLQSSSV